MSAAQQLEHAFGLHQAGKFAEAELIYAQILAIAPKNPDAIHLLSVLNFQQGRNSKALELIDLALEINPDVPEYHAARGQILHRLGRLDEAVLFYLASLASAPNVPEVQFNLGCTLRLLGRDLEAMHWFRKAIACKSIFPDAWNNLGNTLRAVGDFDEAADCYRECISQQHDNARVHVNLAQVLKATGDLNGAIAEFDRAIALNPNLPDALSGKIYTLQFKPGVDAAMLRDVAASWNTQYAVPLRQIRRKHSNQRIANRRLKIGYVSPDFRDHAAGLYLLPLLRTHDRSRFEIHCYSNVARSDAVTEQFKDRADGWRDIWQLPDEEAERLIRDDGIDILVDTTLHMGGNRLLLFARKPAPIQMTLCGYPGTTGVETIDYRFTDPYLDPPEDGDAAYTESSIRLPHSFWCYEPTYEGPVGVLPAEKSGHITLGCLNNFCKVNDPMLELWARVMHAMPQSRLILLAPRGSARARVASRMSLEGIEPSRIEFIEHQRREAYFQTYNRIDIALDTFPCNGHMTSLDALWMGVPMVTLAGQTTLGRGGVSLLSNLELTDLVANSLAEFVPAALQAVTDLSRLSKLRMSLRKQMQKSPLMDAHGFTRGIEAAFFLAWSKVCREPEE